MTIPLNEFLELAKSENHSDDYIHDITLYSKELDSKKLPVIFSTKHLSLLIGLPYLELKELILKRELFYTTYKLRKKSGGYRWIMSPEGNLKYVQGWIKHNILDRIEPHPAVTGFTEGASIKKNAFHHQRKELILNIDLYKFFDSITEKRVYGLFKWMGYHTNLAVDLAKLCCVKAPKAYWKELRKEKKFKKSFLTNKRPILPQGSPVSPAISNLVGFSMDKRFANLSTKLNLNYSRYADDLTFSGKRKQMISLNTIKSVIEDEGYTINTKKIKYTSSNKRQLVTGIVVNQDLSIPSKYKREIFKVLFFISTKGVKNHLDWIKLNKGNEPKSNFKDYLLGKIYFVYSIEPEVGKKMLAQFKSVNWEI